MEGHSLHEYLKRQSTEKLKSLLAYCLQEENYANYRYIVVQIQCILNNRR